MVRGKTRSPWNLKRGSSGSSAGSAATTAAGLVPFALGTETTGIHHIPRHTHRHHGTAADFRSGEQAWCNGPQLEHGQVGPLCRSVEDAAMVFDALRGDDGKDQSIITTPFNYKQNIDLDTLKFGYVKEAFERDYYNHKRDSITLSKLEKLGADLIPISLPNYPVAALRFLLTAEAAAAFDSLTIGNADDQLVRQDKNARPNLFRAARFIPAVEYIQANRARFELIQKMDSLMQQVDLYILPAFGGVIYC